MSASKQASFSVAGKTAIITGAGSGINFAFATLLLSKNCNVVLADLTLRPEAQALVDAHPPNQSPGAVFVKTDVTSWPDLENMFHVAVQTFGDFHVVCPGAGVYEPQWSNFWHPPGSKESKDARDSGRYTIMDINVTHPIRVTQLAISHWLYPREDTPKKAEPASAQNPKRIVQISSIAAQVKNLSAPIYGASKAAISHFTRCLAPLEEQASIRVNGVAPGLVRTPLWTDNPDKMKFVDETQNGWVTPEEVAEAMLRCAEDDSVPAGAILEVGKDNTRLVEVTNDPGPDPTPKKGLLAANRSLISQEVEGCLGDESMWGLERKLASK